MKNLMYLVAVCFTVALIGCQSSQTVSPGAVSACGAKDGAACTKQKSDCCHASHCQREAAPGAVSDCAKSGCERKSDCQKSGCTKSKSDCQKSGCNKAEANLGAVSEGCSKPKSGCGR